MKSPSQLTHRTRYPGQDSRNVFSTDLSFTQGGLRLRLSVSRWEGNTEFEYLQTVIAAGEIKHSCLQSLDVLNVLKAFLINKCERFELDDRWFSMNALICLMCFIAFHPVLLSSCCDESLRPPDAFVKNNIFQNNFIFLKKLKTFN